MRNILFAIVLVVSGSVVRADRAGSDVHAYRGQEIALSNDQRNRIADWAVAFLKSANFSTANQPDLLNQSVNGIQERYRSTIRKNYLVVTFSKPIDIKTVGGTVAVDEIVVGMNRGDEYPSDLFTIDPDGRIVAHEKYGGPGLPPELQAKAVREGDIGRVRVVNAQGTPIDGAQVAPVSLSMNGAAATTDAQGEASVPLDFGRETKWIRVSKAGFDSQQVDIPAKWPLKIMLQPATQPSTQATERR